jgi:hypothetical protein
MKSIPFLSLLFSLGLSTAAVAMHESHRQRQEREMFNPRAFAPVYQQQYTHRNAQEHTITIHNNVTKPLNKPEPSQLIQKK